jgi:hypothetical protein
MARRLSIVRATHFQVAHTRDRTANDAPAASIARRATLRSPHAARLVGLSTLVERGPAALVVSAFPLAFNNRERILTLAVQHKTPTNAFATPVRLRQRPDELLRGGSLRQIALIISGRFSKAPSPPI